MVRYGSIHCMVGWYGRVVYGMVGCRVVYGMRQWTADFTSKSISMPHRLGNMDGKEKTK